MRAECLNGEVSKLHFEDISDGVYNSRSPYLIAILAPIRPVRPGIGVSIHLITNIMNNRASKCQELTF